MPTVALSFWATSCAVALGPSYTIKKQEIRVRFVVKPEPRIDVAADYYLQNVGTRPLEELLLRLPGKRFRSNGVQAIWDKSPLTLTPDPDNPRNMLAKLREPWKISSRHALHLTTEFLPAGKGETFLSFSSDAFFLPAASWSAELLPPEGLFGTGGVPPAKWNLLVAVPDGFQIHTSGIPKKSVHKGAETMALAEQGKQDPYPSVIAGRYSAAEIGKDSEKVHLWTAKPQDAAKLRDVGDALARVIGAYDAAFGERSQESAQIWIVECPVVAGCFTSLNPLRARLLGQEEDERTTAEMISRDTMVVDFSEGTPKLVTRAAPSLAASWLGYGQNPAFFEQSFPLTMLPAFAAAIGHDAAEGGDSRAETIRRALSLIPVREKEQREEDPLVLRVKSFLFFYALQDRYGRETFRKATEHMLHARQERGFGLDDLIAAFEEETHQNVAEFVRMWMKRPGVPEEFRARYAGTAAAMPLEEKEKTP
ncbi:MAG: hypothetical protein DMG40_06255 [Acidobacteria bacterium]|nr:MAG: hypothetical protein DMG40_06255 [Acidobacteriota bacterium]